MPGVHASRVIVAPDVPHVPARPAAVVLAKAQPLAVAVHAHPAAVGVLPGAGRPDRGAVRLRPGVPRRPRPGRLARLRRADLGLAGQQVPRRRRGGVQVGASSRYTPTRRTSPGPPLTGTRRPPGSPAPLTRSRSSPSPGGTADGAQGDDPAAARRGRPAAGPGLRGRGQARGGVLGPAGCCVSRRSAPRGWRSGSPRCRYRCRSPA